MKLSDIFIIYLSCGAPFGVYFFLQNRTKLNTARLWLNSFLTMIVWFPYAFRFLHGFITIALRNYKFAGAARTDSKQKQRIEEIQKEISQIIFKEETPVSLFDFRETIERYAGLSVASRISAQSDEIGDNEKELFRVARGSNMEIGAKCINRRNRKRLKFHQTLAREDFLRMFNKLLSQISQPEKLWALVFEFVKLLNDVEAEEALQKTFDESLQTERDLTVSELESDVWKSKPNQPEPAKKMSLNLQTMSAAAIPTSTRKND